MNRQRGKGRAFVAEEQHLQMHGGRHIRETWRGLTRLKTQVGVGESRR